MASFVTVAELAAWVGKDVSELNTAQAELVLDVASEAIRSACGWGITQQVSSVTLDGSGSPFLWLPTLMLTDVQSVIERSELLGYPLDYTWATNGRLIRSGFWSPGVNTVSVTFTHGYVQVPGVVRAVCLSLAGRSMSNPQSFRSHSETQGGWSESWTLASGSASDVRPGLTPQDLGDLAPFRLPIVL